jgi:hypothetical protein
MDFFLDLIKKILESDNNDLQSEIFNQNLGSELQDKVLAAYAEEDGQMTLAVFSTEQWSMVNDICALTGEEQEDVVRSMSKDLPNVLTFDPKEFD